MRMKKSKRNQLIAIGVVVVCLIVVVLMVVSIVWQLFVRNMATEHYEELRQEQISIKDVESEEQGSQQTGNQSTGAGEQVPDAEINPAFLRDVDFESLQRNENKDIYAWIYIPDTNIDYPIVQHSSDNTYYLNHNLNGTKGYPACIYTELENRKDFSDFQTVIYGHNMRDGSMFHDLRYYQEADYLAEHPYIYIYEGESVYQYRIFAAYQYSDAHLLSLVQDDAAKQQYVQEISKYAVSGSEVEVTVDSHIITLSTCISNENNKRFLVQAVLVE